MIRRVSSALRLGRAPTSRRLLMTAVVVLLAAGLSASACSLLRRSTVPDVVKQDVKAATEALEEKGLTVEVTTREDPQATPGTVLEQTPKAGEKLPEDKIAHLVVAAEPEQTTTIKVPKVVGMKQGDAESGLEAVGLIRGNVTREVTTQLERDTVISQNPGVDKEVALGTTVDLVVADDSIVPVPDVLGDDEQTARRKIVTGRLKVGAIKTTLEGSRPRGTVLGQNPNPDTQVVRDTEVELTVKQDAVTVPKLQDQNINNVGAQMAGSGLTYALRGRFDLAHERGFILSQDPLPGTRVARDSEVVLTTAHKDRVRGPFRPDAVLTNPSVLTGALKNKVRVIPQ